MTAWVALLRGVNVGGVSVRSADLAEVFRGLGFAGVRTVLASGNVAFSADAADPDSLAARIEAALRARFDYDAHILLVTRDDVIAAIVAFPFDAAEPTRQPWVIFCRDAATRDELIDAASALDDDADPVAAGERVVYWHPVKGTSTDSPFAKVVARASLRTRTTNRNLRTLQRIVG